MSDIAFCVLPWPSVCVQLLMFGQRLASLMAAAVVCCRQGLAANPSASAIEISFVPQKLGGRSSGAAH
jgi:hypothetical protein